MCGLIRPESEVTRRISSSQQQQLEEVTPQGSSLTPLRKELAKSCRRDGKIKRVPRILNVASLALIRAEQGHDRVWLDSVKGTNLQPQGYFHLVLEEGHCLVLVIGDFLDLTRASKVCSPLN